LVYEGWNVKTGRSAPGSEEIAARAADARRLLRRKIDELTARGVEDAEVVLVTHGGYLHYLTGDWEDAMGSLGTGWENCEIRSYYFAEGDEDAQGDEAWLVETMESRAKRGKPGPMKLQSEQRVMFEEAMRGWEAQGLTTPLQVQSVPIVDEKAGEPIMTAESGGSAVEVAA